MAIVSPLEIQTAYRYEDEELPFIIDLIMGAEFFLYTAGAYKPKNPMTKTVVTLIVGFWLDNRESNYTDYVKIGQFPLGMQSLITSLQYAEDEKGIPSFVRPEVGLGDVS